jgi:hypothetical protein
MKKVLLIAASLLVLGGFASTASAWDCSCSAAQVCERGHAKCVKDTTSVCGGKYACPTVKSACHGKKPTCSCNDAPLCGADGTWTCPPAHVCDGGITPAT